MPSGRVLMHSTKFSLVRLRSSRKRDSDQIATLTALTAAHAGAGGFTRLGGLIESSGLPHFRNSSAPLASRRGTVADKV